MSFNLKAELLAALEKFDSLNSEPEEPAVRGGNSGVMLEGGSVFSSDSGSCIRRILLRAKGVEDKKELKTRLTFALGYAFEPLFEKLKLSDKLESLQTGVKIREPINNSTIPFRGSPDFILTFKGGYRIVVDTKTVSSLRSFHDTFVERKAKTHYIAQIVNYMDYLGIDHGFLVVASFIYVPNDWLTAGTQRKLNRKVEPDLTVIDIRLNRLTNEIFIDGKSAHFLLTDIRRHREAAAKSIEAGTPYSSRPVSPPGGFSACGLCSFRSTCDRWESEGGDFVKIAKEESK